MESYRIDEMAAEPAEGAPSWDESPNPTSALEWWFVQGHYDGPTTGRRHFMASLFRHALDAHGSAGESGASLLVGVLDQKAARHATSSRVDAGLVKWMTSEGLALLQRTNLDQTISSAFVDEVAACGPPRPIQCDERRPEFQGGPLRAIWGDFALSQVGALFHLRFVEPETQRVCSFVLEPLTPRRDAAPSDAADTPGGMAYATYPRVALRGEVDGEPVTGEVWLDHQWGSLKWLLASPTGGRVLGWDWLGVNLEDGSDWIIMLHRDAATNEPMSAHATVWDGAGCSRRVDDLQMTPVRHWRSPRTQIMHPVAWRIEVPQLDADFYFEPLFDDQEIALFGSGRAIWEGAGTVSGHVAGRAVRGRARGEFQGYGHIFDFQAHLDATALRIDQEIEAFFPKEMSESTLNDYAGKARWQHDTEAMTATLAKPVWDLIARKGKRWRPAFGLLMLETLGEQCEPYRTMLCLLAELAHTGSLIIDDIEDGSAVRRGGPSIHQAYGLDVALNAGSTLYFLPYLLVKDHAQLSDSQRLQIYEIINRVYIQAHCGQGADIYRSSHMNRANVERWLDASLAPKILQTYGYKTAAPIAGFAEIAAVIAGSSPAVRQACSDFGMVFGVAFQILDDVRNFSTSEHWTKIAGEDLAAGKLTYVIVKALAGLGDAERQELLDLLCSAEQRNEPAQLARGIALVHASKALEACKNEAQKMVQAAWTPFSQLVPASEPKILLRLLCERMLDLPLDP